MYTIYCCECQEPLTEQRFKLFVEADEARYRIGHATGRVDSYGDDEVVCHHCWEEMQTPSHALS